MVYVCRLLEAEAAHQAVSVDSPAELFWRAMLVQ